MNIDLLLLLPVESVSNNTDSATLPSHPTLWLTVGLHTCHGAVQPCHDREEKGISFLGSS